MKKKKKYPCKMKGLSLVLLLFLGTILQAQSVKDSEYLEKVFPVSDGSTVEIENKYGTILLVPWSKDSVKVEVEMYIQAKSYSKLRKLKNDINIDFTSTNSYIIARTKIGEGGGRIASEIRTLSKNLSSNMAVEINYTIYIPNYVDLVLINKFGDIYVDDIYGSIDVELSNGSFKANALSGNSNLNLSFAKASVKELGTSTLHLSYAEIEIAKVQQMDLISKSSEVHCNVAGVLKLDSKRDKVYLSEVEYLYGISSFSDIVIQDFIRELDAEMKYGKLEINQVLPDFSRIDLDSESTDVSLSFDRDCSYMVDILHHEKAIVQLINGDSTIKTSYSGEEMKTSTGFVGGADTDKKVSIRAKKKCYVKLSRN